MAEPVLTAAQETELRQASSGVRPHELRAQGTGKEPGGSRGLAAAPVPGTFWVCGPGLGTGPRGTHSKAGKQWLGQTGDVGCREAQVAETAGEQESRVGRAQPGTGLQEGEHVPGQESEFHSEGTGEQLKAPKQRVMQPM